MIMQKEILLAGAALATLFLSGCGDGSPTGPPTTQEQQSAQAQRAANSVNFSGGNAEIENITNRLKLTGQPGLAGYIMLFNDAGQPILYASIRGKVTSGSKRLTPPQRLSPLHDCGEYQCRTYIDAPSDEGTYGSSNPYVYFTTTEGQYYQWSGDYLYSDRPFRTRVEPLVIAVEQGRAPPQLQPATPPAQ